MPANGDPALARVEKLSEQLDNAMESAKGVIADVKKAKETAEHAKKALRVVDTTDRRKKPRPPRAKTRSRKRRRSTTR